MTEKNANAIRTRILSELVAYFTGQGEDVGQIKSNAINFPICSDDGEEEGSVEITITIPRGAKDDTEDDIRDAYMLKREQYAAHVAEQTAKREKAAVEKAAKIARDKAVRDAKRAERERLKNETASEKVDD